jgi:predicted RNase H-like nuclease (RuvC/YqgF family)
MSELLPEPMVPVRKWLESNYENFRNRSELSKARSHNASLVDQLADANKRIEELERKLRGNNELRRIAKLLGVPQETIFTMVVEWARHVRDTTPNRGI